MTVDLNDTSQVVTLFDPTTQKFTIQLWTDGEQKADLSNPDIDTLVAAVGDLLSEQGITPLPSRPEAKVRRALTVAKGGLDAAVDLLNLVVAQRAAEIPCTLAWASTAAYHAALVRDCHTGDGSPLSEVLVSAGPPSDGPGAWDAGTITLHYANGSIGFMDAELSPFTDELRDVAAEMGTAVTPGTALSIKVSAEHLTDYQPSDAAAVAAKALGPGWTCGSQPYGDSWLRHADGSVIAIHTGSARDLTLSATVEGVSTIHHEHSLDAALLENLLVAGTELRRLAVHMHRLLDTERPRPEDQVPRAGLRYEVVATTPPGRWAVRDSVGTAALGTTSDQMAAHMLANAMSLAALAGPLEELFYEFHYPDGTLASSGLRPLTVIRQLLTYYTTEDDTVSFEWTPATISILFAGGSVAAFRRPTP
ncbi:hypothetical protein [Actinacidiphila alni]|nr:hypothetical protein [Actinacidiphila alni]